MLLGTIKLPKKLTFRMRLRRLLDRLLHPFRRTPNPAETPLQTHRFDELDVLRSQWKSWDEVRLDRKKKGLPDPWLVGAEVPAQRD